MFLHTIVVHFLKLHNMPYYEHTNLVFIHSSTDEHLSYFQLSVMHNKCWKYFYICLLFLTLMYSEGGELLGQDRNVFTF